MRAALAVADQVGVDRLTIRAVARRAGVPTMSLYSHFSRKEELLDLMHEEIVRHLFADEPFPSWQVGLLATCGRVRTVLVAHPHWVPLLSRRPRAVSVPLWERLLELMTADGMAPDTAWAALSGALAVAQGFVLLELSSVPRAPGDSPEQPLFPAALGLLRDVDLAESFAVAVATYVKGVETANTPTL